MYKRKFFSRASMSDEQRKLCEQLKIEIDPAGVGDSNRFVSWFIDENNNPRPLSNDEHGIIYFSTVEAAINASVFPEEMGYRWGA